MVGDCSMGGGVLELPYEEGGYMRMGDLDDGGGVGVSGLINFIFLVLGAVGLMEDIMSSCSRLPTDCLDASCEVVFLAILGRCCGSEYISVNFYAFSLRVEYMTASVRSCFGGDAFFRKAFLY